MFAQHALHPFALPPSYPQKDAPAPALYLHQQRTVEVIELIEVPAPPPRSHISSFASSSFASSSYDSDDDSEEDESVCSSYCSSEEEADQDADAIQAPVYDDTYKVRYNRVLAWREGFVKAFVDEEDESMPVPPPSPVSSSPSSSRKRKADSDVEFDSDDDASSQSSKRSRSVHLPERPSWSQRRLSNHSCPACDAGFMSLEGLQQHGMESAMSDACREAVQYGLEP